MVTDSSGNSIQLGETEAVVNGKTVTTLTFIDPANLGDSLADGNYILTIHRDKVSAVGGAMAINYVDNFHRLFGDKDGDGDVDLVDLEYFRQTFGQDSSGPTFDPTFDVDGNDKVDLLDLEFFRQNFGQSLA